jgi:PAS domain S-box-containing protein
MELPIKNKPGLHKNRFLRIPNWFFYALGTLTVIGLVVSGIFFYRDQSKAIHERKVAELKAISALKSEQIVHWRNEWLMDANLYTTNPMFNQAINLWVHNQNSAFLEKNLVAQLQSIAKLEGYQNLLITSPDGSLLLSLDPYQKTIGIETRELAAKAFANREIYFGDFVHNESNGKIELNLAAPIVDGDLPPKAVLVLQVDPNEFLYPLIQTWPIPSQSAETLLVRRDGEAVLYLNSLRFDPTPPLKIRIPLSRVDVPSVQAILGRTGVFEGLDYRGGAVLSVITPIPGSNWFMIAKISHDEAISEYPSLAWAVVLVVALTTVLAIILAVYLEKFRQKGLQQELDTAERERREALEETRTALYSIGDGVITTDRQGKITRLNPVAEKLTGWPEAEALGLPLKEAFHIHNEKTHVLVENPIDRVLQDNTIVGLTNHTVLVARNGTEVPIADSGAPIHGEDGSIIGVVLVFRDQTTERAYQKEQALLNFTIERSLNEIYIFDAKNYLFRYVNNGALENLGYSMEQMKTMTPLSIKPEFSLETFKLLVAPLEEGKTPSITFETVHRRSDGSLYPVEVHLQLLDHEGDRVYLAVILDVTERDEAARALLASEERYRSIFQNDHVVMLLIEPKSGTIVGANPAAARFYGWTMEELNGKNISEINTLNADELNLMMESAQRNSRNIFSFKHRKKNGEFRDVEVFSGPIIDHGKTLLFSIVHDVTERSEAEAQVAEQLEELHRWHSATLGRELRIIELKNEVNELLQNIGQPDRYTRTEENRADD